MRNSIRFSILLLLINFSVGTAGISARGEAIQLTSEDGLYKMNPAWSPDGSKIAFTGKNYAGLWIINSDGTNLVQVSDEPGAGFGFSWSSDSKSILARVSRFERMRRSNAVKIFDIENKSVQQVTDYITRMPVLPQWIEFGQNVLLLKNDRMEVVDSGKKLMLKAGQPAGKVCFWQNEKIMIYDSEKNSSIPLDPVPGSRYLNPQLSPDEQKITFQIVGAGMYVMGVDGRGRMSLGRGTRPRWSPDSAWLVFAVTRDDGYQITSSDLYLVRADGGERNVLTASEEELEMNPDWSPRGDRIVFDSVYSGNLYVLELEQK